MKRQFPSKMHQVHSDRIKQYEEALDFVKRKSTTLEQACDRLREITKYCWYCDVTDSGDGYECSKCLLGLPRHNSTAGLPCISGGHTRESYYNLRDIDEDGTKAEIIAALEHRLDDLVLVAEFNKSEEVVK